MRLTSGRGGVVYFPLISRIYAETRPMGFVHGTHFIGSVSLSLARSLSRVLGPTTVQGGVFHLGIEYAYLVRVSLSPLPLPLPLPCLPSAVAAN